MHERDLQEVLARLGSLLRGLDGDLTGSSYREPRRLLESLDLTGPGWCTAPSYVGLGAELFAACTRLGLEGLVAKTLDSTYRPGERSRLWVKAKCSSWLENHAEHRHQKR